MDDRVHRLTPRQRECLYLVHEGYRHKAIASSLGISPDTVAEHLGAARKVLGIRGGSLEAARRLVRETGLPQNVGGVELGVGQPPLSTAASTSAATPAVSTDRAEIDVVREPAALYEPPSRLRNRSIPLPFRAAGRPWNDVGIVGKLLQITGCALVLGTLAFLLISIIHAQRQILDTVMP